MRGKRPTRPGLTLFSLVLVAVAGCGGGHSSTTTATTKAKRAASSSASALDGCLRPGPGVKIADISGTTAGFIGTGTTAVAMLNESDQNLCSWLPFARGLAARGYQAVVFDSTAAVQVDVAHAVARYLHAHGAKRVVMMGASVGARATLAAAASKHSRIDAAVALSAEERTSNGPPDLLEVLPHLTVPTLMVYTRDDGYIGGMDIARNLYRHVAAKDKHILILPGDAHGTATLPKSGVAILKFLATVRA
jgi:pimeloyl-ACP methyl ester carboxylesterase